MNETLRGDNIICFLVHLRLKTEPNIAGAPSLHTPHEFILLSISLSKTCFTFHITFFAFMVVFNSQENRSSFFNSFHHVTNKNHKLQ